MIRKLTKNEKERVLTIIHCEMIDAINEASEERDGISPLFYITLLKRLVNLATQAQAGEINTDSFRIVMHSELEDYLN